MMAQTVEYLVRLRFEEPSAMLPPGQVGDALYDLLTEIEGLAVEQGIVSRRVVGNPDRPPPRQVPDLGPLG